MSKLDYFLLCESVIRDADGKLTIVNIFDILNVADFPGVPSKFALVFGAFLDDSDLKGKEVTFDMQVLDKKGEVIVSSKGSGSNTDNLKKHRHIVASIDLAGQVPLEGAGIYSMRLYINDQLISEKNFEVVKKPQEGKK